LSLLAREDLALFQDGFDIGDMRGGGRAVRRYKRGKTPTVATEEKGEEVPFVENWSKEQLGKVRLPA